MQPAKTWGTTTAQGPAPNPERSSEAEAVQADDGLVSLQADVPEPLLQAMQAFIERHPNWDQYRLFQAALAGFLVQNGVRNRGITRCYLANLFPSQASFSSPAPPPVRRSSQPAAASGWPTTSVSRGRNQHQAA